ncbi:efflux transporter outer membrane subunit [Acidocella facilis]|uniref:efflux transporter outer membrane subunit n=1 Tax=Acidocella facilis TaxID=525 RepID=UPI0005575E7E|nr:efflux transporter outer membrane subunit [Acidocella facilis]
MRRIAFIGLFALSGCMVGPNYQKPKLAVPAGYKTAPGWVQAQPADGAPKGQWWRNFQDPTLDQLEAQVAVNNAALAADFYAYQQAVALAQEARGSLFPTLALTGSATRSGQGGSSGGAGLSSGPKTSGTFEGQASWTPDIWGKIRRQVQSNVAAAQVSAADLANATLSAQASLAQDYVYLRTADANIALLNQTIAAYQDSLRITQNKYNAGTVSQADVLTAQTELEGAQSSLISEQATRAQYEHAIALLTGHAPADLSIPDGKQIASVPVAPPQVPSTLLQRRPDIAAAERAMAEQNANIGVAVGAYYPDLSLSALGGFSATPIGALFSASNALWSLGASATGDLFEGGARAQAVAAAKAGYLESVETYRQTVLSAFQAVETDLSNLQIYTAQAQVQARAVADAQRAAQIALNEYRAGTVDYTTVVTAQVTLLSDQQTALSIQQSRLLASIALYADLGGGFEAKDLPSAATIQSGLPFAP